MATGIITIQPASIEANEVRKMMRHIEAVTMAEPEVWVYGTVSDGYDLAFLPNGKQVQGFERNRFLLEVDGEVGRYQSARLEKIVFIIK